MFRKINNNFLNLPKPILSNTIIIIILSFRFNNYHREDDNYAHNKGGSWRGRGTWNKGPQPYQQSHRYSFVVNVFAVSSTDSEFIFEQCRLQPEGNPISHYYHQIPL